MIWLYNLTLFLSRRNASKQSIMPKKEQCEPVFFLGNNRLFSAFLHYIDTSMMYILSINNQDFENYLGQMYPLSLRSKTRRIATLLLPTLIYSCRSVGTVNFTPHFMTSVTILISILRLSVPEQQHHIFARLWRFYLTTHPILQGLLLLWMVYSEGGATLQ